MLIFAGLQIIIIIKAVITIILFAIAIMQYPPPDTKKLFEGPFFITGEGKGYHLPSHRKLEGIFGSHLNNTRTYYKNDYSNSGHEAIEFGGIKKTFDADIKSITGICYALRCKKATGDPRGGPLTDFPRATDNSLLCAYRYERGGSFLRNSLNSHLKVQCVYLGSTFTGDINTISNESWWNTQIAIPDKVTTRIFPITGHVVPPIQSPHSMISDNGVSAYIWCQTDMKLGPSIIRIDDYSADLHYSTVFYNSANTVRLFAGE